MDALYRETAALYARAVERLLKANQQLVDSLLGQAAHHECGDSDPAHDGSCQGRGSPRANENYRSLSPRIPHAQLIITFIQPCAKTNFLCITPLNLYTKDDPILRYVPNLKLTGPTAITWYEGTVIGERSLDITRSIDLLFTSGPREALNSKMDYLRSMGRKLPSIPAPSNMEDAFCTVCCLFSCGIHEPCAKAVLRHNEQKGCICNDFAWSLLSPTPGLEQPLMRFLQQCNGGSMTDGSALPATAIPSSAKCANDEVPVQRIQPVQRSSSLEFARALSAFRKHMGPCTAQDGMRGCAETTSSALNELTIQENKNLSLKPCVLRSISVLQTGSCSASCPAPGKKGLPIKQAQNAQFRSAVKELYSPCACRGKCVRNKCSCAVAGMPCELACGCSNCQNLWFCGCRQCGPSCPCLKANRSCSELCKCSKEQRSPRLARGRIMGKAAVTVAKNTDLQDADLARLTGLLSLKPADADPCSNSGDYGRREAPCSVCESPRHGYGLFADARIESGSFVMEYTGEILSEKETERRGNFYEINKCSYLFNFATKNGESHLSVDAFYIGSKSRYINHSTSHANLRSEVFVSSGVQHIVFYATRDIYPGDELLFDYHFTDEHKLKHGILD